MKTQSILDFTAVKIFEAMADKNQEEMACLLSTAVDNSSHASHEILEGKKYAFLIFEDNSVFCFRFEQSALKGLLLYAYKFELEIPPCVTNHPEIMGIVRIALVAKHSDVHIEHGTVQ